MDAFVESGRWRIHYTVQGEGFPLILLHGGMPASSGESSFAKNISALAQKFRTYTIDFPGWGQSSCNLGVPGEWANPMELGGEVVAAFMRALGISKAHLVGGSYGGGAALFTALNHPSLVEKMVLVAPGGGESLKLPTPTLIKLLTYYGQGGPTLEKLKSLMDHMVYDKTLITDAALQERFQKSCTAELITGFPLNMPPPAVLQSLVPLSAHPKLGNMESPVLFVWGTNDEIQPFDAMASFHRIPHQSTLAIAACGHWPYWEYPEEFNQAALKFLG